MIINLSNTPVPILVAIALLSGCDQNSNSEQVTHPRPVKTVTASAQSEQAASLPGMVQARIETDLAFRTLGRIVSRNVEIGDLVRKGDILAEIDPLALRLAVRSAKADLRDAQANLENARLVDKRMRILARGNAASTADKDLAEQQLRSAKANVAKATAGLAKAHEQLGYAKLQAEFDGVVTATFGETGQTVSSGFPILRVARPEQRDVVIDVPEAQLRSMRLGARLSVALQLDPALKTTGVVREISPQADATTRTHRLKIAVDLAPEVFRLGALVTAIPLSRDNSPAIPLPASAVKHEDGTSRVWVFNSSTGTIASRAVELDRATTQLETVRVTVGLREGEEVVVAGVNELADGQIVKIEQEQRP